jgi:hypothetical protein
VVALVSFVKCDACSGYAPGCSNEWVRGVCGKPQVRRGECPNQSFIPVTDEVIESICVARIASGTMAELISIAGVYPLLFRRTCSFLALDFDEESWSSDARPISYHVSRARSSRRARAVARAAIRHVGSSADPLL